MEVILKETIDNLGEEGDTVKVKDGYARNYLIPQGKALVANKANLAILEQEKTAIEARKAKQREEAAAFAKRLAEVTIVIEQRTGEDDKLYGSVTSADIAARLAEAGIDVDRKKILLEEPIKALGVATVPVKIGYQMTADLKVEIVPLANE